ncbi:virion structural protein [Vibrio phage vB_pir03]|nr:virion structural protein [Vibrio phage vB_pir03]
MANTTVKTFWWAQLEAARRPGNTYVPMDFSTLNGYFKIEDGAALAQDEFPEPKLLVIGRGGHENEGLDITNTKQHRVNNARLFEHLPFVLREVNDDLEDDERLKYRLRRLENYNGKDYFAYYAKVLNPISSGAGGEQLTVNADGEIERKPYVPTIAQYDPQPVSMVDGEVNSATDTYLSVSDIQEIVITPAEIQDILDAVDIIYGDRRKAVISEMGIASSFDRPTSSSAGGISANYTEAIGSQVCSFLGGSRRELESQNTEIRLRLRGGNTLPLLS